MGPRALWVLRSWERPGSLGAARAWASAVDGHARSEASGDGCSALPHEKCLSFCGLSLHVEVKSLLH